MHREVALCVLPSREPFKQDFGNFFKHCECMQLVLFLFFSVRRDFRRATFVASIANIPKNLPGK